jgi:hypothetical protein
MYQDIVGSICFVSVTSCLLHTLQRMAFFRSYLEDRVKTKKRRAGNILLFWYYDNGGYTFLRLFLAPVMESALMYSSKLLTPAIRTVNL